MARSARPDGRKVKSLATELHRLLTIAGKSSGQTSNKKTV